MSNALKYQGRPRVLGSLTVEESGLHESSVTECFFFFVVDAAVSVLLSETMKFLGDKNLNSYSFK